MHVDLQSGTVGIGCFLWHCEYNRPHPAILDVFVHASVTVACVRLGIIESILEKPRFLECWPAGIILRALSVMRDILV